MNEGPHQRTSDIAVDYEILYTGGHSIQAVYTEGKPIHVWYVQSSYLTGLKAIIKMAHFSFSLMRKTSVNVKEMKEMYGQNILMSKDSFTDNVSTNVSVP